MKIRLVMLGKTHNAALRAMVDEYIKRTQRFTPAEITELRETSAAALRKLKIDTASTLVLLDAAGKQFTSQQFAQWIGQSRDRGTREMIFLCGDAAGFPEEIRASATQKISLTTLTMPHEFARVLLAEQIYRAFTILSGHPYDK
jgi:23S rRNA (pseudouridine1915-N3)-methyltransferase